jgi:hypothetical protein
MYVHTHTEPLVTCLIHKNNGYYCPYVILPFQHAFADINGANLNRRPRWFATTEYMIAKQENCDL